MSQTGYSRTQPPAIENQDRIWDHYQNDEPERFAGSTARQRHLVRLVRTRERVLNIGVGTGLFERLAIEAGIQIYALDPSQRSIDALRERLGLGDRAQVGYSQQMPFADGSFDAVVISEVMEHLSDEVLEGTLVEIGRVLAPGGWLVGTVPAREDLSAQRVMCPDCGKVFHRWGHQQSFDAAGLHRLLSRHFTVEYIRERQFIDYASLNWKGKVIGFLTVMARRLGVHGRNENLLFVARKAG